MSSRRSLATISSGRVHKQSDCFFRLAFRPRIVNRVRFNFRNRPVKLAVFFFLSTRDLRRIFYARTQKKKPTHVLPVFISNFLTNRISFCFVNS